MFKYETIIFWSEEDQAFVGEIPELPGCMAHGDTGLDHKPSRPWSKNEPLWR